MKFMFGEQILMDSWDLEKLILKSKIAKAIARINFHKGLKFVVSM